MKSFIGTAACVLCCVAPHALAQAPGESEFGVRGAIHVSDGEPANDITGFGVLFRRHLHDGWAWGAAVDSGEFDFEQPARLLGIEQDENLEAIDAKADVVDVSVFVEKHRQWSERWSWFWQGGAGVGTVDVPRVTGPTADGGEFDIETDASTEPFVLGVLGARRWLGRWAIEAAVSAQYRFTDYEVVDSVSGRSASVDGHAPIGIYVALMYRF